MGEGAGLLPAAAGRDILGVKKRAANTRQAVFLDKSLPYEVRYLAIIQLKNGIDKYWRKTAQKCVPSY